MTTNVDFYVLDVNQQKSFFFSCLLLEKLYEQQKSVFVYLNSDEEAQSLDQLLWTYRDDSFLPHHLYDPEDTFPPPIQLGFKQKPNTLHHVLLNLSDHVPSFYRAYTAIIEIVFSDPLMQQLARARYKNYREEGCQLQTHKLKSNECDATFIDQLLKTKHEQPKQE